MKGKHAIVCINAGNPMVFLGFKNQTQVILMHFGVPDQALIKYWQALLSLRDDCRYKCLPIWKQ